MKKSILALSLLVTFGACKKDKTNSLTPTDVTGTTTVKGNISKNVITPNGGGGFSNTSRAAAQGVNVSIKVNKNSLYPNSTAQGADVYTGTTDKNGNYSIDVKTNATGVEAMITIDGFTGTQDTIVNGAPKTGLYTSYAGTALTRTLYMGQNSQLDYSFTASNISSNPNNITPGTAKISGSVGIAYIKEVLTGTIVTLTTVRVKAVGFKVYMNFTKDPVTLAQRTYEATTDSSGAYSFTVSTVAAGTAGFNQNASIWVNDFEASLDTIKLNNSYKKGRSGVFRIPSANTETGVYNNNIRNANNFFYDQTLFVPN